MNADAHGWRLDSMAMWRPLREQLGLMQQTLQRALEEASSQPAGVPSVVLSSSGADAGPSLWPRDNPASQQSRQQQQGQQQQQQGWTRQRQQQQGLCLRSLSCALLSETNMLAALPAHSLAQLAITIPEKGNLRVEHLLPAVKSLSNLQQLSLASLGHQLPSSCLDSLVDLTGLTSLTLTGPRTSKQPLQLLAPPLQLRQLRLHFGTYAGPVPLDLAALSRLTALTATGMLADRLLLPLQLQQLQLGSVSAEEDTATLLSSCSASNLGAVLRLQQLQQLQLNVGFKEASLLQQLSKLTALQQPALAYDLTAFAAETACAWPQLKQLQQLHLNCDVCSTHTRLLAIATNAAACTGLKQLNYTKGVARTLHNLKPELAARCTISDMRLNAFYLGPNSGRWLAGFTALTRLDFRKGGNYTTDSVVTEVARSCKQLQHLNLQKCRVVQGVKCMAEVAQLKQLTELQLERIEFFGGMPQQALMQLTGLSRLQRLGLSDWELAHEPVRELWAAVQARGRDAMYSALVA
jgi:hypothetical protein